MVAIGVMLSYFINRTYFLSPPLSPGRHNSHPPACTVGISLHIKTGFAVWRIPFGFQLVPAGLLLVGGQFMPRSPRWLLEHGHDDEARAVVRKLHAGSSDAEADAEFAAMRETIRAELVVRARVAAEPP